MSRLTTTLAKSALMIIFALTLCVGLTACQQENATNSSAPQEFAIGEKSDNAFALKMTNSAGKSVVSMQVKLPGEETFSANMMSSDKKLTNGETATVYIPKNGQANESIYIVDIKVVFNDGGTSTLHYLDLKDFDACTLLLQGKIGYVTYQGTAAMRMVSTLALQQHYYNLEDPDAAARDAAEEEEEKRRLEKLEEDLKSYEESANTAANTANGASNEASNEEVQDNSLEDDPIETNYDGEGED